MAVGYQVAGNGIKKRLALARTPSELAKITNHLRKRASFVKGFQEKLSISQSDQREIMGSEG